MGETIAKTKRSLDCGFSSHSHLSKQFRQFTGTTPISAMK
ncbi:AraC family transcriptional regulator [Calothrix sp. UHCC 0171]|nr:AraC family transcriptional regulator [Calothrix sp. UHCC 0171]MEA5574621.1 AraC family transcriptional regulator [Calothrix sp. UHCC 0171]